MRGLRGAPAGLTLLLELLVNGGCPFVERHEAGRVFKFLHRSAHGFGIDASTAYEEQQDLHRLRCKRLSTQQR